MIPAVTSLQLLQPEFFYNYSFIENWYNFLI